MKSSIILMWVVVLFCVNAQDTEDTEPSHPEHSVKGILEGLKSGFSRTLGSVFGLAKDKFKLVLSGLKKLKKTVAKGILNKFIDLRDKQHDFGDAESAQRVAQMMQVLETSGASTSYVTMASLTIPLLAMVALGL
ncbi:uncharacterized protein LOC124259087 [Haliotis rubra]|uniref:uncharacterized protein LOC124259087 n=1 Tax=Haliotis rubra TaxID=36100 RepID=UPI001EE5C4EB|nr:uncharacterized protein LOC124259087 [Haliotis rubra]